jgi:hypothetical protein
VAGVMKTLYIFGSMKNPRVPEIAKIFREWGYDAFDDWYSPGPDADDWWQDYEHKRGRTYAEALDSHHAKNVYDFDHFHIQRADGGVLVMPAGKSAHMELGYMSAEKPTFVLFDKEPERYDIMYRFARGGVHFDLDSLKAALALYLPVD